MKQVRIRNIGKDFFSVRRGKISALKSIYLEIQAGCFFVLLGPSGCGKSTLLNIIAGIEKPSRGEIWFGDQLVVSGEKRKFLTPRQRDVAMVFQSYALYPHMSVFENMAFPLKIGKVEKGEIRQRVEQAAQVLEISHLLEARPGELSGGQRQRVALGRAIVRKPNVLLLDEPLSNLDALLRTSMRGELKQIQRGLQVTTIYVTHDQVEAMSLGDQIAVLEGGVVQQLGDPDSIYNDPANLFVAKFVGTPPLNILDGEILTEAQKDLSIKNTRDLREISLGLRPEHVRITEEENGVFRGKLNLVSSLGSETLLYLSVDHQKVLAKVEKVEDVKSLREGQSVGIDFEERKLFVFDKANGRRIK
jgi:multiple sugar transport system ATP-binding protein